MKINKMLAVIGLAATMAGPARTYAADIVVDGVKSQKSGASFVRPNLFYTLAGVNVYSFIEFYSDDTNYFGKTCLGRKVVLRFSATSEFVYGSSEANRVGVGLSYSVPMPKKASLGLKTLPLWLNKDGYDNRIMMGYFGSLDLPAGFCISSFGEFNVLSTEWGYGEASVGKSFGESRKLGIHYNPLLKNNGKGKFVPRIEHAVRASYKF